MDRTPGDADTPSRKNRRPKLDIPRSGVDNIGDVVAAIGVLVLVTLTAASWATLPDSVPTHFNAAGVADAWGSKNSLLLLPAVALVMWAGLTVLARFPHAFNYVRAITPENAARQYAMGRSFVILLKAEMVWLFASIQWMTIVTARTGSAGVWASVLYVWIAAILGSSVAYVIMSYRAG
ncbi:MAG: DUF1648 domain-containing protein [Thermoleophilia bacterium]|nr:DUF1648 domain-containing protein [Thermoleophilia bacterium]